MANLIANGVFKKLIYAKEFELGKWQDKLGEGLTSPITGALTSAATANQSTALGTGANQISFTGLGVNGQIIQIGSDLYRLTGITNTSGSISTAVITSVVTGHTKWVNSYGAGSKVTVLASTETELLSTTALPAAPAITGAGSTAVVGTGAIGDAVLAITTATDSRVIPIGQKFKVPGDTVSVYEVTGYTIASTGADSSGATVAISPTLKTAITNGQSITFVSGSSPQFLRRVTSNLDLKLQTFKSAEIRSDMQRSSQSVGSRSVDGTISGELSNKTYYEFMESILRRKFTKPASTTVVGASVTGAKDAVKLSFVFTSNSNIVDRVKVGDVVQFTNASGTATGYESKNVIVTGVTATTLEVDLLLGILGAAVSTSASSYIISLKGKKSFFPKTEHTIDSYAIEHLYSDIGESELFLGCRATQMSLKMSPSAMATIDVMFMGTGMTAKQTQQLPNALDAGTDNVVAATNGAVYLKVKKGNTAVLERVGLLTSLDLTINLNGSNAQVIGSDTTPDVFLGAVDITGNTALYFQSGQYRDMFLNQEEASLVAVFRADGNDNGEFISIVLPKIQASGATRDDGEKGLIMTMPFTALLYDKASGITNFEDTSVQIQDSSL